MEKTQTQAVKGGEFLIRDIDPSAVFIPEEWTEEQKMMAQMCTDFLQSEVHPILDRIDSMKEPDLLPSLMDKAGELGMLGISIPEEYGGMGQDFLTGMYMTEKLGPGHSFSVGFAAHTGIGTLPLLYFGTEEQKQKYLPKLATGEWKASYCLTEPGSGSDALAAKTTAVLSDDGKHYILNGQKIWITNGGFADLFTVFAKIDGKDFTAFLVPATYEGVTRGEEEHKMGIKGSSTRAIFFSDVKVPVENVLGEIGRGHVIAFNILNIGRIKLAAASIGGARETCNIALKYAVERQQFNTPIANFGAIQYKLAEMAIRIYALESANYRASYDIQQKEEALQEEGKSYAEAVLGGAEEFAIECALLKVLGSEVLDYVVDEAVQIFGGNGYSQDYPVERAYRDSRINRIFEGTNEINRLLGVDMVLKRALKGRLDLMGPVMAVQNDLMSIPSFGDDDDDQPLAAERKAVAQFKKALLLVAGASVQKFMQELENEQEIIMNMADMALEIYNAESALLRTLKLISIRGEEACRLQMDAVRCLIYDAADRIHKSGRDAVGSFAEGDTGRMMLMGLKRYTKVQPVNVRDIRRAIAARMIETGGYPF